MQKEMISILIPMYNEEENLPRIKTELFPLMDKLGHKYEIVIVDDGSKDSTLAKAKDLAKQYPHVKMVENGRNLGLGMAVRNGLKAAEGELLITLDSDFTFHPDEIPKLLGRFEKGNVDCVIGSHFSKHGKTENIPFYRIFLSKSINLIYSLLMKGNFSSVTSIFRLYKTEQVKKLDLTCTSFDINAEILFKLIKDKRKIAEVPVKLTTRQFGESKLNNVKEIKNHINLILKMLKWKVRY
jgi:dolichol-phosphate mannosyltransferase